MAPFFRSYLETLGVDGRNVVFSEDTSEEMWAEGARYGSVDPCFPAKVTQAHIHQLLFKEHTDESPLHYVFFPCITHLPTFLDGTMDSAACPIVAGTPEVMKAAFTKEVDFFATRGIEYLAPALTFNEHNLLKRQLFEVFGPRLGVTRDENDFAVDEGWKTLDEFDRVMQEKGRNVLEEIERDDQIALLMLGRPYHSDPGLNHTVMDEFQVLGYPILSMRSLPRDRAWLQRFFEKDLKDGKIRDVLGVDDVWPEAYSSNSAQKVWSARFAARHPNIAVLDLSSFKCGHDAPTYGIIDNIISTAGTPYSALHDIDANKPTGSIRIRVKTYAHSLKLHKERLEDVAAQKEALSYRVDEKRVQLLRLKQEQIQARSGRLDVELERQIEDALGRMRAYEAKFEKRAELPSGMISVQSLSLSKKRFQREGASV
jgi:predicted nucleotide-binding protein (sugar kinase/HSP70/actin superfamily)